MADATDIPTTSPIQDVGSQRSILDRALTGRFSMLRPIFEGIIDADLRDLSPESLINAALVQQRLLMAVFARELDTKYYAFAPSPFSSREPSLHTEARANKGIFVDSSGHVRGMRDCVVTSIHRGEELSPPAFLISDTLIELQKKQIPLETIKILDFCDCGLYNADLVRIDTLLEELNVSTLTVILRLNFCDGQKFMEWIQHTLSRVACLDISLMPFVTKQNRQYWRTIRDHQHFTRLIFIPETYIYSDAWWPLFEDNNDNVKLSDEWIAGVQQRHRDFYNQLT